jgi:hypothetical protein
METQTQERPEVIAAALKLIDEGLGVMQHRELVSTAEMSDLLLDVRMLLTATPVSDN